MSPRGGKRLGSRTGITDLPGFAESLRLLVEEERYTLTDVAMMFDVSRERIRQLAERFAINVQWGEGRGLYATRLWDDEKHRFRPVSNVRLRTRATFDRALARGAALHRIRHERLAFAIPILHALQDQLGRSPTWGEMAEALGVAPAADSFAPSRMLSWLKVPTTMDTRSARKGARRRSVAWFWKAVGMTPRPRGGPGHLPNCGCGGCNT